MSTSSSRSTQNFKLIGPILGVMILSTFFYDTNTVGITLNSSHVLIKLTSALILSLLPQLNFFSSPRSLFWIVISCTFFHGLYNGLVIDCAYHNGINQAMIAGLIISKGLKSIEVFLMVALGILLSWVILEFGPGFSYVESFKASPMGDYLHGSFIYGFSVLAIFRLVLLPMSKKEKEISRLAGIGLKSKYLIHEVKNMGKESTENETLSEILEIINLIASGMTSKRKVSVEEELKTFQHDYRHRLRISNISFLINSSPFEMQVDLRSFKIIVKNVILNAIEYLEESSVESRTIEVEINQNSFTISNPFLEHTKVEKFFELNRSTKSNLNNQGIGLNIVEELCGLNNIEIKSSIENKMFTVQFSQ